MPAGSVAPMGEVYNGGFELAGAAPGLADGWTLRVRSTAEEIATYPEAPDEGFEAGWANDHFHAAFAPGEAQPATYGALALLAEGFETGWDHNETYLDALGDIEAANFGPSKPVEDFEDGWPGVPYLAPMYLAATPDLFETGWKNGSYLTAFAAADLAAGITEDFSGTWAAAATL